MCSGGHRPAHSWNLHQVSRTADSTDTLPGSSKTQSMKSSGFIYSLDSTSRCGASPLTYCSFPHGLSRFAFSRNRYQTPECDGAARSRVSDTDDPFQGRDLTGSLHFTPQFLPVPHTFSLYQTSAGHFGPHPVMVIVLIRQTDHQQQQQFILLASATPAHMQNKD